MAAVDVGVRDVPPINDDLDELFNYDVDNDLLRELDTNMDVAPKQSTTSRVMEGGLDSGLGLDEEIKITKKRAPIAKLDETRLLSKAGIPKLRRVAKQSLRFKGKGHEYSDVARLLNFYQLWLDDLYPRAKFADGLAMIEKLGHTKRMQTMRKEWINEGKAKHSRLVDDQGPTIYTPSTGNRSGSSTERQQSSELHRFEIQTPNSDVNAKGGNSGGPHEQDRSADDNLFISDGEDTPVDDLDALLAEDDAVQRANSASSPPPNEDGNGRGKEFDDEEEAMAGIDDMW